MNVVVVDATPDSAGDSVRVNEAIKSWLVISTLRKHHGHQRPHAPMLPCPDDFLKHRPPCGALSDRTLFLLSSRARILFLLCQGQMLA